MPSDALPDVLINGRYQVIRTLGQGAFGRTMLVQDQQVARQAAVKMLHPQRAEDWKSFELFEREAAVLGSLRHHGVPEVYEVFRAPWGGHDAAFLVMEYIAGDSLATRIEQRRHADPADTLHLFQELLGVLDYLHGRVPPILHRDIKPANIIVRPDGFPALVDFGAVRSVIAPASEQGSTIVGTYGYMPYEQHMGQATPSSDLYALAATFLHLLTGRIPPEFINAGGRLEVPAGTGGAPVVREVLSRMLAPSPAERYQSAREVRQALLGSPEPSPERSSVSRMAVRRLPVLSDFPPAPRVLKGLTKERFAELAPGALDYLDDGESSHERTSVTDMVLIGFFSLFTLGVLPLLLSLKAAARRRRLRTFFSQGSPAIAEIVAIQDEVVEFKLKIARVRYEFEVDGALHRDADEVFSSIANKWRPGDRVEILYLPERNFDSLIISTR